MIAVELVARQRPGRIARLRRRSPRRRNLIERSEAVLLGGDRTVLIAAEPRADRGGTFFVLILHAPVSRRRKQRHLAVAPHRDVVIALLKSAPDMLANSIRHALLLILPTNSLPRAVGGIAIALFDRHFLEAGATGRRKNDRDHESDDGTLHSCSIRTSGLWHFAGIHGLRRPSEVGLITLFGLHRWVRLFRL